MPMWHRLAVVGVVMLITVVVARLIDRRIARRDLAPEAITRYRVVRRSVTTAIVFVALLSALLVIPQVRVVAGGLLASSAVVRARVEDELAAERLERELRLRAHEVLRAEGVFA